MTTRNQVAMLTLAVITAASLNATVMAQGTSSSRTQFSKVTVRRNQVPKRTPKDSSSVSFSEASQVMVPYKQWMIGANKTGYVVPKLTWSGPAVRNYNLKGTVPRKFLQYEKQGTWRGINLGWTDNASASTATKRSKWFFRRPGASTAVPIRYGERIAIAWGKGSDPKVCHAARS